MRLSFTRASVAATLIITGLAGATAQDKGDGTTVLDAGKRVKGGEERLKRGATGQELLIDTTLDDLRAVTAFRELMEAHPAEGQVTVVSTTEPGERIAVQGKVVRANGEPAADAMVYVYQTDSRGWYAACCPHVLINSGDINHARLFAYVRARTDGTFTLYTVMPQGYPRSDLPAHIHVHVDKGNESAGTEFQFADDPRMTSERRARGERDHFLIAERVRGKNGPEYHYTLTID